MNVKEFEKKIKNTSDIYSFVSLVFDYASMEQRQILLRKYNALLNSGETTVLNKISLLAKKVCVINLAEFNEWQERWLNEFRCTDIDKSVFCYITLLKIDEVIKELIPLHKPFHYMGSFNDIGNKFYYKKMVNSFFSKKLKENKIREYRQTVEYNSNSINRELHYFEIVGFSELHGYEPEVKHYNFDFSISQSLKVGVSSFSNSPWFKTELNNTEKTFSIKYNENENRQRNDYIKHLLRKFEENEVDIVVFPELTMNPETKIEIQKFLINSKFKNIKLCFLGSGWGDKKNEAILLSNQGTVLITEQKQMPYSIYNKEEGELYFEEIKGDKKIMLVDLEGIGRIVYLICADFNNESINMVCSSMHADFVIVSAYSNNTNQMYNTATDHAKRKAITTILCNSCAPISDDETYSSFVVSPKILEKKIETNETTKKPCMKGIICDKCVNILTINQ